MAKTVVILGGSYAGLHVAHYLLKKRDGNLKVILVSKNSHMYWNMASVRAVVPGVVKDEEVFQPLEEALKRYPSTAWELVIGSADHADFAAKTVQVSTAGAARTIAYDELVLATGSRCADEAVPWKAVGTYEATRDALHETSQRVKAASHIVVAGAGATGVELAGELGFEYGKTKEIVLLCGGKALMGGDSVGPGAANELKKLGVKIRTHAMVESTRQGADGKTEVLLGDGETIATDLYLPTMGLVPNSEYVDPRYLDKHRNVVVDEFMRVKGVESVWALGDIVSKPRAGFMITQKQAGGVAKNVDAIVKGKAPTVVKGMPFDVIACAIGRSRGAGRMGSVKMFSLMVYMAKGKTLGLQMVPTYIDGSVA